MEDEEAREIKDFRSNKKHKKVSEYEIRMMFETLVPCTHCFNAHYPDFEKAYYRMDEGNRLSNGYDYERRQHAIDQLGQTLLIEILKLAKEHFKDRKAKEPLPPPKFHKEISAQQFGELIQNVRKILQEYKPKEVLPPDKVETATGLTLADLIEKARTLPPSTPILTQRTATDRSTVVPALASTKQVFWNKINYTGQVDTFLRQEQGKTADSTVAIIIEPY